MKKNETTGFELSRVLNLFREIKTLIERSNPSNELMTIDDVVNYSKLSKQTWYHYTSQGKVPYYKSPAGKTIFFKKSEIDNWLTSNPIKPRCIEENPSSVFNKADEILKSLSKEKGGFEC